MSVLDKFGVSAGELADHSGTVNYPKQVEGRVAHIDADFIAYQVSSESKAELDPEDPTPRKSFEDMCNNVESAVRHITALAGATSWVMHVTPSGTDKGGRSEQAVLKEYQANRKSSDEKPECLDRIRTWMSAELGAIAHMDQEADDGMAQAAWKAQHDGTSNLCVVCSMDKDLLMVPGLHLLDDKVVSAKDNFGHIALKQLSSSKKCVGLGTKFFWAQLLMGDFADNISGLPAITGRFYLDVKPTQAYEKDFKKWSDLPPGEEADRLERKLDVQLNKTKPCGQVMAYELLRTARTDAECYRLVKSAWLDLEKVGYSFVHWKTQETVTATQAMFGDMQTLWMRRDKNKKDCLVWLKERLNG